MPSPDVLRESVQTLATIAASDIATLVRQITDPDVLRDELFGLVGDLALTYGEAAATVAADWYDETRETAGIRRRFRAFVPEVGDLGTDELVRWGISPLYQADPDPLTATQKLSGGLQRRIANQARQTITLSSIADPDAEGWQRKTTGTSCGFCQLLASRGAVYRESSVGFASHDDCDCYAIPAFAGQARPVKPYTPSARNVTDRDRARLRAYLNSNAAG